DGERRHGAESDAGEGEAAHLPVQVRDGDHEGDTCGHLVAGPGEVDPAVDPHAEADDRDQAVEHEGHSTEHARGDRVDYGTDLRGHRQRDRDQPGDPVRGGGVDAGGAHDADVLAV